NVRDLARYTKDEFINRLTSVVGDESKNKGKNESLNLLRLQLAFRVLTKFQVKKDIQIQNRTKVKQMATEIWFLLNSYVDDRLNNECNEIIVSTHKIKNNNLNTTCNSNDLESSNVDVNADLKQIVLNMHKEISDLKESNSKILEVVTPVKGENDRLKKFFENYTEFKNFNLFNNDDVQIIEDSNTDLDDVFEPQFVQKNGKKISISNDENFSTQSYKKALESKSSKTISRLPNKTRTNQTSSLTAAPKPEKPAKIFDYYTGFWSLQSDELSVKEFISKFAIVESIEELKTKWDYYKSYRFSVKSYYMEHVLNPNNWPDNIRVKRFYEPRQNNQSSDQKKDTNQKEQNNSLNKRTQNSRGGGRGGYCGRGGFSGGFKP
ncbi:unnamed protein product, partial [Brachionus calyciflorus]